MILYGENLLGRDYSGNNRGLSAGINEIEMSDLYNGKIELWKAQLYLWIKRLDECKNFKILNNILSFRIRQRYMPTIFSMRKFNSDIIHQLVDMGDVDLSTTWIADNYILIKMAE
jgi:predicted ribosome-associated RNA-binding protein Tma20